MSSVDFIFEGKPLTIQCNEKDKMDEIIKKFCEKINKNKDEIYFIYGGNFVKENKSFTEIASSDDIKRKKLSILCNLISDESSKESEIRLKKSKYIICPKCQENACINIKDFKIELLDKKNNHVKDNISFSDFEKTQMIDESKIKCNICEKLNKSETYNNSFFICFTCKKNICPLCNQSHDKSHIIIDYSEKDFKCNLHNESNSLYCNECNKDICVICEKEHLNHKKTSLGELIIDKNKLEEDKNHLRTKIDEFEKDIQGIIKVFNDVIRTAENYYNIYDDIITNYDMRYRNYQMLQNINHIQSFNNNFITKLNDIIENKNINSKFETILEMWNKINIQNGEKAQENNKYVTKQSKENETSNGEICNKTSENLLSQVKNLESNNKEIKNNYDYDIENIEKIKAYKKPVNQSFEKIISLEDKRILLFSKDIIVVQDLKKNKSFYKEIIGLSDIDKLLDGNLILIENKKMKLIEINENDISIIKEWNIKNKKTKNIYALSNGQILTYTKDDNFINFYKYDNKDITLHNKSICTQKSGIDNICQINENEIAVTCCEKGLFYGDKYNLIFYNINNNISVIRILDISGKLCLLKENYLIVAGTSIIYLVDLIKHGISLKISAKHSNSVKYSLTRINGDSFIIIADNIYQYDLKNKKIVYSGSYIFNANLALMISENKLLVENLSGLSVFQFPKK